MFFFASAPLTQNHVVAPDFHISQKTTSVVSASVPTDAFDQRAATLTLGPPALATLTHRLSVLSKVHQLNQAQNPCQDPKVRELISKTRRAYAKRGVRQGPSPARNCRSCPSACGTIRISENRIAPSKPNRRSGWSVISAAASES